MTPHTLAPAIPCPLLAGNVWLQAGEERRDRVDVGLCVKNGGKGLYVPDFARPLMENGDAKGGPPCDMLALVAAVAHVCGATGLVPNPCPPACGTLNTAPLGQPAGHAGNLWCVERHPVTTLLHK